MPSQVELQLEHGREGRMSEAFACLPAILLVGVSEPSPLFSQLPNKKRSFSEGLNKYILQIVFLISFYLFVFGSGPLFIFQTV